MDGLGEKLCALLLPFGYLNKKAVACVNDSLARPVPFLKRLPRGCEYVVETRKQNWLVSQFVEALRSRGVTGHDLMFKESPARLLGQLSTRAVWRGKLSCTHRFGAKLSCRDEAIRRA